MYIDRVKAGGSPERNYFVLKLILHKLILYRFLRFFLWLRVNLHDHRTCHMVRRQAAIFSAQKHPHVTIFQDGKKCVFHLFHGNYVFAVLLIAEKCHNS